MRKLILLLARYLPVLRCRSAPFLRLPVFRRFHFPITFRPLHQASGFWAIFLNSKIDHLLGHAIAQNRNRIAILASEDTFGQRLLSYTKSAGLFWAFTCRGNHPATDGVGRRGKFDRRSSALPAIRNLILIIQICLNLLMMR